MNNSAIKQAHSGKIALVTGSNKGLGREIARRLGLLGMTVFASARNEGRSQQTVKELQNEGIDVHFLQLDVTDESSVRKAAAHIDGEFGRLDVLINNAANPGFVATDLNTHTGGRSVEQGAEIVVELATLDEDGPTGVFLGEEGPVPW